MKFPVKTEVTVYFSDCDPMGHCNNARFFTFMEQARIEYFKKLKPLDLRKLGPKSALGFILAEATCTFRSPAFLDEKLVVALRVSEVRNRSFLMEYEIREKKTRRLVATGQTAQVMFNYKKKRPFPIPLRLKRAVDRLQARP